MKEEMKQYLMMFILEKVKQNTTEDRPYYFIRWTGLSELCKSYGFDLVQLIDEMCEKGMLKKALIKGRLAVYIHDRVTSKKLKQINSEFEEFIKKLK